VRVFVIFPIVYVCRPGCSAGERIGERREIPQYPEMGIF
jgi:hypothetical protein